MSFWDFSLENTGRTQIVSIQYQEQYGRAKKPVFMRVFAVSSVIPTQSGDFSFTPNTTEITVNTAGVYRIDYSLLVRPAAGQLNIAYAVAINGLENPLSFFGTYSSGLADTQRTEVTGMFIASIAAGSTVALRNKSSTTDYLAGTGIDHQAVNHAAILLQRIA